MLTPAAFVVFLLSLPTETPYSAWADRHRFPPSTITVAWHEWAVERRRVLEQQIAAESLNSMRPWVRDDLQQQLRECEEYWAIYMRYARLKMTSEEYRTGLIPWGGNCGRR